MRWATRTGVALVAASAAGVLGAVPAAAAAPTPFPVQGDPTLTQSLYGSALTVGPGFATLGGVAFLPGGDPVVADCGQGQVLDFSAATTEVSHGAQLHPAAASVTTGPGGVTVDTCGLTNFPDGYLYASSPAGIARLDPTTAAVLGVVPTPYDSRGNGRGIAVDTNTAVTGFTGPGLVYESYGCQPVQQGATPGGCPIIEVDPATGTVYTVVTLPASVATAAAGLAVDPTGTVAVVAVTRHLQPGSVPTDTDAPNPELVVLDVRRGTILQQLRLPGQDTPEGVAFHRGPGGVVDYLLVTTTGGAVDEVRFPAGSGGPDYGAPPTVTPAFSGGFRGNLIGVGADGCAYVTQAGTAFPDGTVDAGTNSVVQLCDADPAATGSFAVTPGTGSAPPAAVPEAPWAATLPVAAGAVLALGRLRSRRRTPRGA